MFVGHVTRAACFRLPGAAQGVLVQFVEKWVLVGCPADVRAPVGAT